MSADLAPYFVVAPPRRAPGGDDVDTYACGAPDALYGILILEDRPRAAAIRHRQILILGPAIGAGGHIVGAVEAEEER